LSELRQTPKHWRRLLYSPPKNTRKESNLFGKYSNFEKGNL
jgi:hypothetical protein